MNHLEKYYKILKLKPGASLGEVKQAYRDLAKVWHPDCFPDAPHLKQKAEEEIKKINEAYQQLKSYQPVSVNSSSGDQTANYSTYRINAETYYKREWRMLKKVDIKKQLRILPVQFVLIQNILKHTSIEE